MTTSNQATPYVRPVIGFTGGMHSGKTTAAMSLMALGFVRVRFAAPLKGMLHSLGLTAAELDGDLKEQPCALLGGVTPRQAMRTLGTEWGRQHIHTDLWVNAWKHAVGKKYPTSPIVADDVRFQNEVDAIHEMGGVIVKIVRNHTVKDDRTLTHGGIIECRPHASEQFAFDGVDHVIRNNGSIEQLREQVRQMARGLTQQPKAA